MAYKALSAGYYTYPYDSAKYQGKRIQVTRWTAILGSDPSPWYVPEYPTQQGRQTFP